MWDDIAERMPDAMAAAFTSLDALFRAGGPVLFLIFAAALTLWTLIAERWWFHRRILPRQLAAIRAEWRARPRHQGWSARQIRRSLIGEARGAMQANAGLMHVLIPLCPLLGLIGTVSGMLDVFDVMAIRGLVDARAMADGVSRAMVCTLAGLGVSISGLFFVRHYSELALRKSRQLAEELSLS